MAHPEQLHCTEPNCGYTTKKGGKFPKQELGRHLKFAHGIAGATASAKTMQKKKAANLDIASSTDKYQNDILEETRRVLANGRPKKERKQYTTNSELQAAFIAGKIAAYCEAEAEKLGVSKEQFTRKVSELFFAAQVR